MTFFNLSFKKQFYLTMLTISIAVLLAGFSFNILSSYEYKKESFINEAKLEAGLISDNIIAPMMFFDVDGVNDILAKLKSYESIVQVVVYDSQGEIFARYNPNGLKLLEYKKDNQGSFLGDTDTYMVKNVISVNNIDYGTLYLEKSSAVLKVFLKDIIVDVVVFSLILLLLVSFLILKLSDKLLHPIIDLSEKLTSLSESKSYDARLTYKSDNEIGKLYDSFNNLLASINAHEKTRDMALAKATSYQKHLERLTNELEERVDERTEELQESISVLKKAQNQLVESEKMAALGSLVSGVAHEVNTPLGNAVTGSSIIKSECSSLLNMMHEGNLKKSSLENKLEHIEETSRLLFKSVNNAADLIKSFKKISVDQSVERKREFDLHEYINEIIFTFHNKLKRVPVDVKIVPDEELIINSYPGTFAQLFNNFIQNSIIHAFEDFEGKAEITIEEYVEGDFLYLNYSDNGNGIKKEIKEKAFEPFVTTKRNSGGTGIGLNIVYNLVTQKLHGEIDLDSTEGKGTSFKMKIPLEE